MTSVRNNPIFNKNKFKIGTFASNTFGSVHTSAPEGYVSNWQNSLRLAQIADRAGYEAILGLARWKNPGKHNVEHRGNVVLDSFTWTAGLAMATSYSALFATTHAPTVHPLVVAKQCATIDQIANGRFGLNVVGGWTKHEFEMFGLKLLEHDARYDYLSEWMTVIIKLWESTEEFDFDGKFLHLKGALSRPQPVQNPHPPILNAAMSGRGQRFAGEFADVCFVSSHTSKEEVASYKRLAREQFGREVAVWMSVPIVQRRTRAEAEEALNYFTVKHEDGPSVDGWVQGMASDTRNLNNEAVILERRITTLGGVPLVGSAQDVADQIEALSEKGVDGMLSAMCDYEADVSRFAGEVIPLLERRGLREPFTPPAQAKAS